MIARSIQYLLIVLITVSCNSDIIDDPIPSAIFDDILIDLDFSDYTALKRDGGFVEITESHAGIRGIILYRHNKNAYFAYEKNCSYRPNEACATVSAHSSGLFMIDVCCGSTFNFFDGNPTGGPAWQPLRRYRTRLDKSHLVITDDIQ